MTYTTHYTSPLGDLLLAERDGALVGLWIAGQRYFGIPAEDSEERETPVLALTKSWLDRYFAGENPRIDELPLSPVGSDFQRAVWDILREIPYGEVTTYGEIAKKIALSMDKPRMSAQAVGGAVGRNPISIIIPCHRVVGADGSLTGYAGGIDKKVKLLSHEGADITRFSKPKSGRQI